MLTNPSAIDLYTTQMDLEDSMVSDGIKRFRDKILLAKTKNRESTTGYGVSLLSRWVLPLAEAIKEWVQKAQDRKIGSRASAHNQMIQLDPEMSAYITCKVVLDRITTGGRLIQVVRNIGSMIEDEVRFRHFSKEKPGLFHTISENIQGNHYRHRRTVLGMKMKHYGVEWVDWTPSQQAKLGIVLVDLLVSITGGAIEVATVKVGKARYNQIIRASAEAEKWVADKIAHDQGLLPVWIPMVVKPQPWTAFKGGGYLCRDKSRQIPLVKAPGRLKRAYREEWDQRDGLDTVYGAVNALQDTPWRIHQGILGVLTEAWDHSLDIGSLPVRDQLPLPAKPEDIATNKVSRRIWKMAATEVYRANIKLTSKRILTSRILQVAKNFKDYERIYFPHNLDFRGRAYAVPLFLNPQGCDHAKALLQFAEGKALGNQQAADWLAIHGANTYGHDKVSFKDRVLWVLNHTQEILLSAMKPLEYRWWTEADKPWQFLAFCMEWRGYMKEKFAFVSHLPIALDGSCNGLQHFSAMLRDEIGGKAVNLIPSETPKDVYLDVADKAVELLTKDAARGLPWAAAWLAFGITRDLTKRPVMVVPYGGTRFSCRAYVKAKVAEMVDAGAKRPNIDPEDYKKALGYLAGIVWNAIGLVVVSARSAMDYLRLLSRVAAKEDLPVYWTSPSGFPVLQVYAKRTSSCIESKVTNFRAQITLSEDTDKLDRRRQEQGISPNFVHSLDAAALMFTVTNAVASGVTNFSMIHDSYATHACDTEVLAQCCRIAFVEHVYSRDVLGDFTKEVMQMLPDGAEVPEMPQVGSLDLKQVLDSPFFFA